MAWAAARDLDTHTIIGAAMEVHRELGPGFLEAGYSRALRLELETRGIPFEAEVQLPMVYKGQLLGVPFRVDLVCCGRILVELKALPTVGPAERSQLLHYLRCADFPAGLLLNFGGSSLHVERVNNGFPKSLQSLESQASVQS